MGYLLSTRNNLDTDIYNLNWQRKPDVTLRCLPTGSAHRNTYVDISIIYVQGPRD